MRTPTCEPERRANENFILITKHLTKSQTKTTCAMISKLLFPLFLVVPLLPSTMAGNLRGLADDVECKPELLLPPDVPLIIGSPVLNNDNTSCLEQESDGRVVVREYTSTGPGVIIWASTSPSSTGIYHTILQRDSNMITRSGEPGENGRVIWESRTVWNHNFYYFGLSCDGTAVQIARGEPNEPGPIVFTEDVIRMENRPLPELPTSPIGPYEIVLTSDKVLDNRERTMYHNGFCSLYFKGDGNMVLFYDGSSSRLGEEIWRNPFGEYSFPEPNYKARLNDDNGSLEIYWLDGEGMDRIYYSSNNPNDVFQDTDKKFMLVMDEACGLHVLQNGAHVVWSSNQQGLPSPTDMVHNVLQRGQLAHYDPCLDNCNEVDDINCESCPQTLHLQNDCNLIQYSGRAYNEYGDHDKVWAAGTNHLADECYLYADNDNLRLYGGKLDRSLPRSNPHSSDPIWEAEGCVSPSDGGVYSIHLDPNGGLHTGEC